MASLQEIRAGARAALHARAALAATYQAPDLSPAVAVTVRVQQGARLVRQGGGEFETLELDDDAIVVVFARAELDAPELGAVITVTETGEQLRIARLLAPTVIEARTVVERI